MPQPVAARLQQQQVKGALSRAEDPLGASPWEARSPAGGPGSVAAPEEGGGADETGGPVTPFMNDPEEREGLCMPLTPPLPYSRDTSWPPADARFRLPTSGYSHWTDENEAVHVIYADDVRLPLPPAYQQVHTMNGFEASGIAALAEWAREYAMEQAAVHRRPGFVVTLPSGSMPLTPPLSFSMDSGFPPADARFRPPESGYSHWTDAVGEVHVICAADVPLPLPPRWLHVHAIGVPEAVAIAAAAEAARSAQAPPGAARDGTPAIGAPQRAIAPAQRLQPRRCTSQEGHRCGWGTAATSRRGARRRGAARWVATCPLAAIRTVSHALYMEHIC